MDGSFGGGNCSGGGGIILAVKTIAASDVEVAASVITTHKAMGAKVSLELPVAVTALVAKKGVEAIVGVTTFTVKV